MHLYTSKTKEILDQNLDIQHSYNQGRTQDLGSGGEASDKISNKVARISVRGGDIQQKFTQQRLLKNFEKLI